MTPQKITDVSPPFPASLPVVGNGSNFIKHDSDNNRKAGCRAGHSPRRRCQYTERRLLHRERLYGHVGARTPCVARHARSLRLRPDAGMTGSWENTLMQIERHTLEPSTFMAAITGYTRKATAEIPGITMPVAPAHSRPCPRCGKGNVLIRAKTARCDNTDCGLLVFRRFLNKGTYRRAYRAAAFHRSDRSYQGAQREERRPVRCAARVRQRFQCHNIVP